jgi:hypothetical protein
MISPGMSTEERLRAATRAAADTVPPGSAPPLRLPAGPEGRRLRAWFQGGRLRRRRPAALTPLAAAAAVIVVLAAAVAVTVAHSQPGHHAAGPPGHHESLLAQLPPYYLTQAGDGPLGNATHVQVRATPTGKVLATVRPPRPYTVFSQVSAAGDGHEFVLLASRWRSKMKSGYEDWFTTANKFFLLRFDPHTHVPMLTALPIPLPADVLGTLTGVALSPGGLKLAVAWHRPRRARTGAEIQVFNLVTGAVKTWTWPGGQPIVIRIPGAGQVLSWAEDGTLAFQQRTESSAQVRLLDTNGPGGSLQADSRQVLAWPGNDFQYGRSVVTGVNVLLTPSGSRLVTATVTITRHPLTAVMSFTEYSTRTGRVVRQLGTWTLHNLWPEGNRDVLWTNASGSTLIVVDRQPGLKHVTVSGGGGTAYWRPVISVLTPDKFVPLPRAPSAPSPQRWPAW